MTLLIFFISWYILLGFIASHIGIVGAIYELKEEEPFTKVSVKSFYLFLLRNPKSLIKFIIYSAFLGVFNVSIILRSVPDKYFKLY